MLYGNLDRVIAGLNGKAIAFIGTEVGAGTSTIVSRLAKVAVTHGGLRLLILDADMQRPSQLQLFGVTDLRNGYGFAEEGVPNEDIRHETSTEGLWIAHTSRATIDEIQTDYPNSTKSLLAPLDNSVDSMFIDCPPLSESREGLTLSAAADGTVLIIEAESALRPALQKAQRELAAAGGRVIGAVLNKRRFDLPQGIYRRL
jgi:Mrp family chromosome partitioning ATPase